MDSVSARHTRELEALAGEHGESLLRLREWKAGVDLAALRPALAGRRGGVVQPSQIADVRARWRSFFQSLATAPGPPSHPPRQRLASGL